jgi:imidazolonepropionase-like amidohydrolase
MIAVKAGKLIDGTGAKPQDGAVILIEGNKITQVGPANAHPIPPGTEVIDASRMVVMPGMIDGHVHVQGQGGSIDRAASRLLQVTELTETTTLKSYTYAKENLAAGFTTIADMSSRSWVGIALRDAINDGLVEGPRMRACGQGLCITGGHMDGTRWRPEVEIGGATGVADSPWAFRQATRHQIKMGADCIKINICSGAHANRHTPEQPFWQEMTYEEMEAVCQEAHKAYLRVFCHSSGGQGITDGILAGVDSLEHAHWISDEQADLMAERGTYYVPTFTVVIRGLELRQEQGITGERGYLEKAIDVKYQSLERVHKAGAKIALGTDAGFVVCHGENARELEAFVDGGMTPMEAIMAATSVGADHLDMGDLIGTVEAGKLADLVIVDGDPLQDVRILQDLDRIKTVIKDGRVVTQRA